MKWHDVTYWVEKHVFRPPRVLVERVRTTVQFLPVIWRNTYDFDYEYALDIFAYKLSRLEKVLRDDSIHEGASTRADEIQAVLRLMDVYRNVTEHVPMPEVARYGFVRDDRPGFSILRSNEEFSEWVRQTSEIEDQAWSDIWRLIEKNARGWWC